MSAGIDPKPAYGNRFAMQSAKERPIPPSRRTSHARKSAFPLFTALPGKSSGGIGSPFWMNEA